jgi:hypothetical protein
MLNKWYVGMTHNQRKLVWIVSILAIVAYGIGVPTTLLLLYLHLGARS